MKKTLLVFAGLCMAWQLTAQQQQFTMQEAVLGLRTNLAPANVKQLQWIPQQQAYVNIVGKDQDEALLRTAVPRMQSDTLWTLQQLNKQLSLTTPLKAMPAVQWINNNSVFFTIKQQVYKGLFANGKWQFSSWISLPEKAENITWSQQKNQFAYTIENQLYLYDVFRAVHKISDNGDKNIVYGQSVHRNEFGIDGGVFFSPLGNFIAFYRMDQTMVKDYPIIQWSSIPAENENIKYPMAGGASHEVTLGIYNPLSRQTVYLQTGTPKDQYLTCVTWSPEEKFLFVALLNRAQNHLRLNQYDAKTGAFIKTLFEEHHEKYVEPQHALAFLPQSKTEFLWWSQRDGFMHLYRYNTDGKLLNPVTKGNWLVNSIDGYDAARKKVIVSTTMQDAREKHVYEVDWTTGKMKSLDKQPGIHTIKVSDDGKYLIDAYQNSNTPRNIDVAATTSAWRKNILSAQNTLGAYIRPKVEDVTLTADDGTPLYGKLIYPTNFDAQKKYPVVVYLYNGPHVQLVTNGYPQSGNLWYEYLAQRGYVVFTMDGRGSSNRGLAFEQATFRQLGTIEMNDQLKGVAYLKSLPFVNSEKMGVQGWSFGGFMTTSLMLKHPDIFACGVAGGPVIDWSMYEIMYTERYMDTPQDNSQGYANSNLLSQTKNLKGKLLMIHGAQDNVVVWQHSINFVKACVDNGVQIDYFVYPGHEHNVLGKDRVHLMQKITDYFDLYLK
jgi:dipeptidyl-peptidase-4